MAMGDPATAAIVADKSAASTAGKPAAILSPDPLDAPATTAVEDAQRSKQMNETMASGDGMTVSHGNYVQRDAGRLQTPPDPSTHGMHQTTETYVCPMHAEVKSTVPGKCTKCGMALMKTGKTGKR